MYPRTRHAARDTPAPQAQCSFGALKNWLRSADVIRGSSLVAVAFDPRWEFRFRPGPMTRRGGTCRRARARSSPATVCTTSPVRRPARCAGPRSATPMIDDAVVDLGRIEAEPGPRRPVGPAVAQEVVEDRLEQIDRDDHVEVAGAFRARGPARAGASRCRAGRPAGPIIAVPPQLGWAGAVKIASSSTYSQ